MPLPTCSDPRSPAREPRAPLAPDVAIAVRDVGKCYRIYDRPQDRLRQALFRGRRQFFREFWALRNISLDIYRGETVGIIGRNGCGKSTLLQIICNTLTPTTGQVQVGGRVAALLELGAGFNPDFSGRENVYTNAAILGLSWQETEERFQEIVDFSELGEFIDRPVKTYSSGMHVRLAFAVASTVEPDILVVDEALAVGDEAFQRKCFARLQAIQRRGGTILFVSHSAGTIVDLCSRAVLLDHGEHLLTGSPKAVVARYHKLAYAPADKVAAIREEIRQEAARGEVSETSTPSTAQPTTVAPAPPVAESSQAYLDPHLKSKSTVVYESQGARIHDAQITTPGGRPVNVLASQEEYVVRYRVVFSQPAFQVRFGAMLKHHVGTELSGIAVPRMSVPACEFVPAGTEVRVAFRFRCQLLPGVYFANVGLMGLVSGTLKYLHRMEDALIFRVAPGTQRAHVGIFDMFVDSQIEGSSLEAKEAA
jgi:lipopolysaccharide transport system ATP-binding protein